MGADQITWPEISAITAALASAIAADGAPEVVVGVLRGGMVPAVLVAHHLAIRDVRAVALTHTEKDGANAPKTGRPVLANPASLGDVRGRDVLVVDDVVGSGDTLAAARDLVCAGGAAGVRTAACVLNLANWPAWPHEAQDAARTPTYLGHRSQRWVVFPWEVP